MLKRLGRLEVDQRIIEYKFERGQKESRSPPDLDQSKNELFTVLNQF